MCIAGIVWLVAPSLYIHGVIYYYFVIYSAHTTLNTPTHTHTHTQHPHTQPHFPLAWTFNFNTPHNTPLHHPFPFKSHNIPSAIMNLPLFINQSWPKLTPPNFRLLFPEKKFSARANLWPVPAAQTAPNVVPARRNSVPVRLTVATESDRLARPGHRYCVGERCRQINLPLISLSLSPCLSIWMEGIWHPWHVIPSQCRKQGLDNEWQIYHLHSFCFSVFSSL